MADRERKNPSRSGVDEYGRAPIHLAAKEGNAPLCSKLVAAGADPNAADDNGWTPLHFAAQAQSIEATSLLLSVGAKTESRDKYGNTPLWRATMTCRERGDVISLLRGAGADPYSKNDSGVSPVDLARTIANYPVAGFYADLPAGG